MVYHRVLKGPNAFLEAVVLALLRTYEVGGDFGNTLLAQFLRYRAPKQAVWKQKVIAYMFGEDGEFEFKICFEPWYGRWKFLGSPSLVTERDYKLICITLQLPLINMFDKYHVDTYSLKGWWRTLKDPSNSVCVTFDNGLVTYYTQFTKDNFVCIYCKSVVTRFHSCRMIIKLCKVCGKKTCGASETRTPEFKHRCELCNNNFFDENCLASVHAKKDWCEKNNRCKICFKKYSRSNHHACNELQCTICKQFYLDEHDCYMFRKFSNSAEGVPKWTRNPKALEQIAFFDFETAPDEKNHQVVVCAAICIQGDPITIYSFNNIDDFFLFVFRPQFNKYHFFAHNAAKFDTTFVMDKAIQFARLKEDGSATGIATEEGTLYVQSNNSLARGFKFLKCSIKFDFFIKSTEKMKKGLNVAFRDSCLLFPRSLRDMAKALGVSTFKGYFPYHFAKLVLGNPDIVIPFPEKEEFKTDSPEFDEWYDKERSTNNTYHVFKEMEKYCKQDVVVLANCMSKFRETFMELTKNEIDPLSFNTAASFAQAVYLTIYAPQNHSTPNCTIMSSLYSAKMRAIPDEMYEFFTYVKNTYKDTYQDYRMEGYDPTYVVATLNNVNYYFLLFSCFTYGHDCRDFTLWERMQRELKLFKAQTFFANKGEIREMLWSCDWSNEKINEKIIPPPHFDIFKIHGGLTEVYSLIYTAQEDEEIVCYDVVSEYPSVQKFCPFPIGLSKYIKFNETSTIDFRNEMMLSFNLLETMTTLNRPDIRLKYFGMFFVFMIPPKKLFAPTIPIIHDDKRYFALCNACVLSSIEICTHSKCERGCWVSLTSCDIILALKYGYELDAVDEGWYFPESCCNWELGDYNLLPRCYNVFEAYVTSLMTIKDEATRTKNKALREIAKLLLNSLWGKIGQRLAYDEKHIIFYNEKGVSQYNHLRMRMGVQEISNMQQEEFLTIGIKTDCAYDKTKTSKFTNHIVANFVTSYGRAKLLVALNELHSAGLQPLYVDTDSVTFVKKINQEINFPWFPVGGSLGFWENEADKIQHTRITKFMCTARKMYAWFGSINGVYVPLKFRTKGFDMKRPTVESGVEPGDLLEDKIIHDLMEKLQHGLKHKVVELRFQTGRDLKIQINPELMKEIQQTTCHRRFIEQTSVPFGIIN